MPSLAAEADTQEGIHLKAHAESNCKCVGGGRNLVVCIDGTSNQYGKKNTNVVEIYSRIIKSLDQLTYYNSGIGTYARPSWRTSWAFVKQWLDNKIDLAIAWNLEKIIQGAYRWLSEQYKDGDRIYLFGFSRGAYQVRVLAAMIEKVGLIYAGNEEQIPFAYELYADSRSHNSPGKEAAIQELTNTFKKTFSRRHVRVHFLGVWDTVSSVGIVRSRSLLPLTDTAEHICYFRHALALDERRVKFLPEYMQLQQGMSAAETSRQMLKHRSARPHVKEVWFAGSHSDIGGGVVDNVRLDLGDVPVLWMANEAMIAGLMLEPSKLEWDLERLRGTRPTKSLGLLWSVLEALPVKRLKIGTQAGGVTWGPHWGKGRVIHPWQKLHVSVGIKPETYIPRAVPVDSCLPPWSEIVGRSEQIHQWLDLPREFWELDIFDNAAAGEVLSILLKGDNLERRQHLITLARSYGGAISLLSSRLVFSQCLGEMLHRDSTSREDAIKVLWFIQRNMTFRDFLPDVPGSLYSAAPPLLELLFTRLGKVVTEHTDDQFQMGEFIRLVCGLLKIFPLLLLRDRGTYNQLIDPDTFIYCLGKALQDTDAIEGRTASNSESLMLSPTDIAAILAGMIECKQTRQHVLRSSILIVGLQYFTSNIHYFASPESDIALVTSALFSQIAKDRDARAQLLRADNDFNLMISAVQKSKGSHLKDDTYNSLVRLSRQEEDIENKMPASSRQRRRAPKHSRTGRTTKAPKKIETSRYI